MVGLGAALFFFGVAILSPLIARPLSRAIGAPFARLGTSSRLGRENASRNPRRTASTASALMIGLALVAFVSIFAASLKASASATLDRTLRADYIVTNQQFQGFGPEVATRLAAEGSFSAVAEIRDGVFGVNGTAQDVSGVTAETLGDVINLEVTSGRATNLAEGELLVDDRTATDKGWHVGDTIPVEFSRTGEQELQLVGIFKENQLFGSYLVSLDTFETNFAVPLQLDTVVLLKTAPGVSPAQAKSTITAVTKEFPNVRIQDQAQYRDTFAGQVNVLLGIVTALLALALIIALFGIVNTLALSVYERTREIGLLRAIGMSRKQTRRMIRLEAVIIAVFGAVLGTAVGIFFGWAMAQALKDQGFSALAFPVGQLVLYVVIAGLAGVVAAILPARHAAKLDVLESDHDRVGVSGPAGRTGARPPRPRTRSARSGGSGRPASRPRAVRGDRRGRPAPWRRRARGEPAPHRNTRSTSTQRSSSSRSSAIGRRRNPMRRTRPMSERVNASGGWSATMQAHPSRVRRSWVAREYRPL